MKTVKPPEEIRQTEQIKSYEIPGHDMQLEDVFREVEGIMTGMARSVTSSAEEDQRKLI